MPPRSGAMYGGKLIPPDYAWVDVTWTNSEFDEDEINIPTEEGYRFIGATIGMRAHAMEQEQHCLGHADTGVITLTPVVVSPG